MLQILSVSLFEKVPKIKRFLSTTSLANQNDLPKQLQLLDF